MYGKKYFMCTLEQLRKIFPRQYYIIELDSIVLDALTEELSQFNK